MYSPCKVVGVPLGPVWFFIVLLPPPPDESIFTPELPSSVSVMLVPATNFICESLVPDPDVNLIFTLSPSGGP